MNTLKRDPLLEKNSNSLMQQAGYTGPQVSVYWNSRLTTTAGFARVESATIELNYILKTTSDGLAILDNTLRHELAHLLAHSRKKRHSILPHGKEWKQACADLGIPNEKRCHSLPVTRRKLKRNFSYVCTSCSTKVERVKPFKKRKLYACATCCKAYNKGRYSEKFRLIPTTLTT